MLHPESLETMDRRLLSVILFVCIIAGTAQGLLLPLLSYMQELRGVSPSVNGLNSAALYVGMMGTSLFVGRPIRRFGYKPVILAGGWTVTLSLLLYPVWDSMAYWLVLRLLTGVGITSLHFASQLWIMSATPSQLRGKTYIIHLSFGLPPFWMNPALNQASASIRFSQYTKGSLNRSKNGVSSYKSSITFRASGFDSAERLRKGTTL
jgi:MFS family permease